MLLDILFSSFLNLHLLFNVKITRYLKRIISSSFYLYFLAYRPRTVYFNGLNKIPQFLSANCVTLVSNLSDAFITKEISFKMSRALCCTQRKTLMLFEERLRHPFLWTFLSSSQRILNIPTMSWFKFSLWKTLQSIPKNYFLKR